MRLTFNKILLILPLFCIAGTIIAQPPPSVPLQAIAKDALGNPARNRKVFVKDIIIQGTPTGTKVWEEAHEVTSDNDGIYTINVGSGVKAPSIPINNIGAISWGKGPFFLNLKIAIAPSIPAAWWVAADNYIDYGTTQMLSVPYALFAGNASVTNVNTSITPGPPGTFLITDTLGNVNWQTPQAANVPTPKLESFQLVAAGQNVTLAPNTTTRVNVNIANAKIGDAVFIAALGEYTNFMVYGAWVSGPGVVSVRFANLQAVPVAVSGNLYKIVIIK